MPVLWIASQTIMLCTKQYNIVYLMEW